MWKKHITGKVLAQKMDHVLAISALTTADQKPSELEGITATMGPTFEGTIAVNKTTLKIIAAD